MIRPLSPQQASVAALVAHGLSYRAIAAQLGISHRTVESYVYLASARIDTDVEYGISPYRRVQRWALITLPQEFRS